MSLLKWSSKYSVDVEEMDKQHKKLVDLINDVHAAMKTGKTSDELGKVFNELVSYTMEHFTLEEKYMAKSGHSGLAAQKKMHKEFTDIVKGYKTEFENGNYTSISIKTMRYLMDWTTNHIIAEDKKYSEDFKKAGIK